MKYERIARAIARQYFWPGAMREDVEQEALLALIKHQPQSAAFARLVVRRHLIEQVRRETRRRPQFTELKEAESVHALVDLAEVRERLRQVRQCDLSALERRALMGVALGYSYDELGPRKSIDNARVRALRKLAA